MNNNNGSEKTREIPIKNEDNAKEEVLSFEEETAKPEFEDAVAVTKEEIKVDGKDKKKTDNSDTSEFYFDESEDENNAIDHKELNAADIGDTAREYYNANHSAEIDEKINAIAQNADEEFGFEETEEQDESQEAAPIKKKKESRKEKKNKRRGRVVSDDDIAMLTGAVQTEEEPAAEEQKSIFDEATNEFDSVPEENNVEQSPEETEDDELIALLGKKGVKKTDYLKKYSEMFTDELPCEEYTDRMQDEVVFKSLRNQAMFSVLSVILTAIVTIVCFYFELAAGTSAPHPSFFEVGRYSAVFAMSMLQLMCFGIMLNLDGVKRAFLGLRPSKSAPESVAAFVCIVCAIHAIVTAIVSGSAVVSGTFCSVGCLALLMLSLNSFAKAYTSFSSFCIVASKAPKYTTTAVEGESGEKEAFEKYLDADTQLFTVGKADFIKDFFKKVYAVPKANTKAFKIMAIVSAIALVVAVIRGFVAGNAYAGVTTFCAIIVVAVPFNILLATVLPYFVSACKAKKTQTAFIGEAACDFYDNAGVVSFDDTEVFPPKNVKVTSIKTYGENRIDKVILYMAKIFDKVKGPLSYVFANSVQNADDTLGETTVTELFADGICVKIADNDVLVGNGDFMKVNGIEIAEDNIDDSFVQSHGSIMYMAVNGSLAAKFYIKYTINKGFESILYSFYNSGICVGIKTLDPCITTELICSNLKGTNYPIAVIKMHREGQVMAEIADCTDSSVVTLTGSHNFLRGFISLDRLRNVYRSNTLISAVSALVGVVAASIVALSGVPLITSVLFGVLFQLAWCIPTVLFSVLSK